MVVFQNSVAIRVPSLVIVIRGIRAGGGYSVAVEGTFPCRDLLAEHVVCRVEDCGDVEAVLARFVGCSMIQRVSTGNGTGGTNGGKLYGGRENLLFGSDFESPVPSHTAARSFRSTP